MELSKKLFDQYFKNWAIELPEDHLTNRLSGTIFKAGWNIRYIFGKDDGREFLEFYATHRMTDDRHCKIYDDGEMIDLDAICSMYVYDPMIPGDREKSERENRERNNRIYKELETKGLNVMTINTYLSLNDVGGSRK